MPALQGEDRQVRIDRLKPDESHRFRAIRLAALRDAPDAFGSTFEEAAERSPEEWERQLRDLPTFVASRGGVDVGIARGSAAESVPDEPDVDGARDAFLLSTWVAPEARGQGAGEALIGAVIEWARDRGFERLLLDVGDHNAPAIALYDRMGFEPTGDVGNLPPPREHVREHRRALRL